MVGSVERFAYYFARGQYGKAGDLSAQFILGALGIRLYLAVSIGQQLFALLSGFRLRCRYGALAHLLGLGKYLAGLRLGLGHDLLGLLRGSGVIALNLLGLLH